MKQYFLFIGEFQRDIWILAAGWFVASLGFAASIPFISIYFYDHLGMSTISIGLFFGVVALVRSLVQVISGELSDRIGRRGLLIYPQFVRVIAFVFIALSIGFDWGFWHISFWLLVSAVCGAIFMPAINATVTDLLPKEKQLDGFAFTRAAGNLGWAVGPAVGGILSNISFVLLFNLSAVLTFVSGLIFLLWMKHTSEASAKDPFKLSDLLDVRKDRILAVHSILIFILYLVVAQLIMPFSLYTVEIVGITKIELGLLYGLNGLIVALFQIPITRIFRHIKLTSQLAIGAFLYMIGYGSLGIFVGLKYFIVAMVVTSFGEVIMSPPSLTLTARLAPEGRSGRYMGIYGFFVTAGWSLGPLYGGAFLDTFKGSPAIAWLGISSLALVAGIGYLIFGRTISDKINRQQ